MEKLKKPRPDFPLFCHARGYWCKKVRGKLHYFGKIANDPNGRAALDRWLEQRDDLLAGRVPMPKTESLTIRDLCNRFLTAKRGLLDAGEISPRTFAELHATCKRIGDTFGWHRPIDNVVADDFDGLRRAIAKQWGPVRLGNEVGRVRGVFKYGYDAGMILQPVRFGPTFKKPSGKVLRIERARRGPRMIEAADLCQVIDAAPTPLKAMILLGINCAFGNTDVANLPCRAVNLKNGWLDFPRPKTGIPRRCPLWPDTVAAIREALAHRPTPCGDQYRDLIFLRPKGGPWCICKRADRANGDVGLNLTDFIGRAFSKLMKDLSLHQPGVGFYSIRHVFQTVAEGARDLSAAQAIMGHAAASGDMSAVYRERIDDARLVAVVNHVRSWLFGEKEAT